MTHLPPPVNGVTMMGSLVAQSEQLRNTFDVRLIPFRSADSIDDIGRLNLKKLKRALYFSWRLLVECLVFKPHLVYFTLTPTGTAFYRDLLYVFILKMTFRRRIFHLHGKGIAKASGKSLITRLLYTWAFNGSSIILLSPLLYDDISGVAKKEQCFYLPNGIADFDEMEINTSEKLCDKAPHILFLSNLIRTKGPMVLLEAMSILVRKNVEFKASFAGAWESEAFKEEFESYLRDNDLTSAVAYIGPKYGLEKENILANADIFAFPSYNDTFPLVILEAMRQGLPIVSTYEGAIPDMVQDGENGLLVPVRNPDLLADRLLLLISNPLLRKRMGLIGRKRYELGFTKISFEKGLHKILDEVA